MISTKSNSFVKILIAWTALVSTIQAITLNKQLSVSGPQAVVVPENYSLSFDIKPTGVISDWGSILHYTTDKKENSRVPAIWFYPKSLRLYLGFSTSVRWDEEFTVTDPLTLHTSTKVVVQAIGKTITVSFNGVEKAKVTLKGTRFFGPAFLFASDPWHSPAKAIIGPIDLKASQPPAITCTSSSPDCCWVWRVRELMKLSLTGASGTSTTSCCIPSIGITCEGKSVIRWDVSFKGVTGPIPAEIGNLVNLKGL